MKVYLLLDVVQTDGIKTAQPELQPELHHHLPVELREYGVAGNVMATLHDAPLRMAADSSNRGEVGAAES